MTKKLEELLNLPDSKEIIDTAKQKDKKTTAIVQAQDTQRDLQVRCRVLKVLEKKQIQN
jgi:hypothetical protein